MTIDEEKIKEEFKAIFERFEKLEKKGDDMKEQLFTRHSDLAKVVKKEISELQKRTPILDITGIKISIAELRELIVELNRRRMVEVDDQKEVLREFHKEFYDIISIIAKDEWDSDTSANLRTRRDRIKKTFKQLNADSIHDDPLIKKYQEKFQEIKDGSKSADSGGILGGAKKKRNIDLKADEEPSKLYTEMTPEEKMKEVQKIEVYEGEYEVVEDKITGVTNYLKKEPTPSKCLYWEAGHKVMNCKECTTPNQNYCIHRFKPKEKYLKGDKE